MLKLQLRASGSCENWNALMELSSALLPMPAHFDQNVAAFPTDFKSAISLRVRSLSAHGETDQIGRVIRPLSEAAE